MASIAMKKNIASIFQGFLDEKTDGSSTIDNSPTLKLLNKFTDEDFYFQVKFNIYEQSINASAAKVVVDFQNSIYRIAALYKYGKADIRKLSPSEKKKLEVPFKISNGSTLLSTEKFLSAINNLIEFLPMEHRAIVVTATLLMHFSFSALGTYQKNKFEIEKLRIESETKIQLETLHAKIKNKYELEKLRIENEYKLQLEKSFKSEYRFNVGHLDALKKCDFQLRELYIEERNYSHNIAMLKMEEKYKDLAEIIKKYQYEQVNNISHLGEKIEINGDEYSKEILMKIKKELTQQTTDSQTTRTKFYIIAGHYCINEIDIEENTLTIENIETKDIVIVFFTESDPSLNIEKLKENANSAIGDKRKIFRIKFFSDKYNPANGELISIEPL